VRATQECHEDLCGLAASEVTDAETVTIDGREIPASQTVCPVCEHWWLDTRFDMAGWTAWRATCPHGHQWTIMRDR
jgi:hypothetical protein